MNVQHPLTDEAIRAAIARRATRGLAGDLREYVLAATAAEPQRRGWGVRLEQGFALPLRRATLTLALVVVLLLATALVVALVGRAIDRPTPGRLAYLAGGDLYVAGPEGESPRLLWDVPTPLELSQPVWIDSGRVLVARSSVIEGGVYLVDVATGDSRLLNAGGFVALSADRRRVATMPEAGVASRLRIVDVGSGAVLADIPADPRSGPHAWSPDGRWLVGETPDSIYRIDVRNGELTELVTGLCCGLSPHWPTWSPDGTRVVYIDYHLPPSRQDSLPGAEPDCSFRCGTLWMVDADGGEPTRLTPELGSEIMPAFSPDGRWIAYVEESIFGIVQREDLAVIAADGSGRRLLTPDVEIPLGSNVGLPNGRTFAWDPDSGGLLYLRFDGSLWHITLDGRASRIGTPAMSEFARQVVP